MIEPLSYSDSDSINGLELTASETFWNGRKVLPLEDIVTISIGWEFKRSLFPNKFASGTRVERAITLIKGCPKYKFL